MKLLILSDSHGAEEKLRDIITENPDAGAIAFLGDGERDFENALAECDIYPYGSRKVEIYQVAGNCDLYSNEAVTLIEKFGFQRVLITHGYEQHVKEGLFRLYRQAKEHGCSAALFGHTHIQHIEEHEGITFFNPGSVRNGCYGVMTEKYGRFTFEHKEL